MTVGGYCLLRTGINSESSETFLNQTLITVSDYYVKNDL